MNQRVTAILLLALVISGGATFLVYRAIRSRGAEAGPPHTEVAIAARTLEIGALIKDSDIQMGSWNGVPPPGMVTKKDGLLGRGVIAPVYAGEPVMESRLAAPGAGGGLAATIPPGMRAVAVRVNDIVGVAGFVGPGTTVDVLISGVPPGGRGNSDNPEVKTILQNIQVLSAGQNYQKDSEGKPVVVPVVNMLVTPEQAEVLSLASNETRIQLILRNPLDTASTKPPGTAKSALFGGSPASAPTRPGAPVVARAKALTAKEPVAKEPVAKEPPGALVQVISAPPYQIQIFNGEKQSEAKFPRPTEGKK